MNTRTRLSIISNCSACLQSYLGAVALASRPLIQQQTRGAKTSKPKAPETMPVRLLKDIESFGRKGNFVPVPTGTMRNYMFPGKIARYATFEEKKAIKRGEIDVVRENDFVIQAADVPVLQPGMGSEEAAWSQYLGSSAGMQAAGRVARNFEIKAIEPSRALSLLEVLLPDSLEFERKAIPRPQTENKSKLPASVQAMLKAYEAPLSTYGSVTTGDVSVAIREAVSYNDEAAQIQIGEANIKFVGFAEGDDPGRIKHLGLYEIEISYKGADNVVKKKINIREPDGSAIAATIDPSLAEAAAAAETGVELGQR